MEQLNNGIISLARIYIMSIINISLVILILLLKKLVDMSAKITVLKKVTKENNAILTDKL